MRKSIGVAVAVAAMALALVPAAHAATVERVTVESHDGVDLGGWLIRPADAGDTKLPTVLISTPYFGQCIATGLARHAGANTPCWPTPETPADWAQHPEPVERLVSRGYAVAWFSVRGTGASGGCWDDLGADEQRDQEVLVDWVAGQPWSNGRVGMMGLSYMAQTAMEGAAQRPEALKTIVVGGLVNDLYSFYHSPQGLASSYGVTAGEASTGADISLSPAGLFGGNLALTEQALMHHHERLCPETARLVAEPTKGATGVRDAQLWAERSLRDRLDDVEASVLVVQGLQDLWQSGHAQQEDTVWESLTAPKAMYIGQWGHTYPWQSGHAQAPPRDDLREEYFAMLDSWLDHFLKGGPTPDILGKVRYEDAGGGWNESTAWPPVESDDEALFLHPGGSLSGEPPAAEGGETFRAYPQPDRATAQEAFTCPHLLDAAVPGGLVYVTPPAAERTVIAGNPMAYLDLEADQTGGGFQVMLHELTPEFDCSDPTARRPPGVTALTIGGADLRFHDGGFEPEPFDGGHVRVDIANLATVIEPGNRLAVTVSWGDPIEFAEVGHAPDITVRSGPRADSSQVVIPVREGGFGGDAPEVQFPPRP